MSLRHRKKLLNENLLPNQLNQSDESDESEVTRKGNNFELVIKIFFSFMAIEEKITVAIF